jgi:hypothetical protein
MSTWYPSRYGVDDEAGALNEITADAVVAAAGLVRTGRVFDLAHVLHADVPAFPGRTFTQVLQPDQDPVGTNQVHWVVEQITATQQMGTHVDGLNHLHDGDRTYNGHRLSDIRTPYGTNRLGIDTLPQVLTRGLCLDVAAVRGVDRLPPGEVITPEDAEKALAAAGLAVRPGDAVLARPAAPRVSPSGPPTRCRRVRYSALFMVVVPRARCAGFWQQASSQRWRITTSGASSRVAHSPCASW